MGPSPHSVQQRAGGLIIVKHHVMITFEIELDPEQEQDLKDEPDTTDYWTIRLIEHAEGTIVGISDRIAHSPEAAAAKLAERLQKIKQTGRRSVNEET